MTASDPTLIDEGLASNHFKWFTCSYNARRDSPSLNHLCLRLNENAAPLGRDTLFPIFACVEDVAFRIRPLLAVNRDGTALATYFRPESDCDDFVLYKFGKKPNKTD